MEFSRELTNLLNKDTVVEAFEHAEVPPFTDTSQADLFEVTEQDGGTVLHGQNDAQIHDWVQTVSKQKVGNRMRLIFIDGIDDHPDKIPMTSALTREIFRAFGINHRFAHYLLRQRSPGRAVYKTLDPSDSLKHELWYSAVIRSDRSAKSQNVAKIGDLTRQVLYWQKCCIWSGCQLRSPDKVDGDGQGFQGPTTYLIWRCPDFIKEAFYHAFTGEDGKKLLAHPMIVHAFLLERIMLHAHDFLAFFSGTMYTWENLGTKSMTPEELTERSRAFLLLSRRIRQAATDLDILSASCAHLHAESAWLASHLLSRYRTTPSTTWITRHEDSLSRTEQAQSVVDDIFSNVVEEVKLVSTYSNLYLERSKIGVEENFAMVNQRDAEINMRMASESTSIALASHQDNRSLRIIQVLGVIFLPASFVSGIFGMGFFTTNVNDNSTAVFYASGKWWIYFAVSVPLTAVVVLLMWFYQRRDAKEPIHPVKVTVDDVEMNSLHKKWS